MEYTYMGLFSTIFGWVMDAILSPVFEFIGGLISDALSWIFNSILAPILENVLWPLFQELIKLILDICGGILYNIFAKFLFLLDTMNQTFNYLIGLDTVSYKGQRNMTLLEVFFQVDAIRKAFWVISFMSLGLAMVLSIYAVIKSTLDFDFENKRPVSRVLSSVMKCFINLFTVQFFVYAMVYLSTAILKGIDTAMNAAAGAKGNMSMGSMIFAVCSLNAAQDDSRNLSTASEQAYQSISVTDSLRKPFFYGESPKVYSNVSTVKEYFKLGRFDYLIGFLLAFFLLVVMAACLMIFVQRMFDMLMLYVASPLFVSMIPLDDGERFGKWREMFIGKCFSGFGMVLAMKLYLLLCPQIMTSDVQFSESVELDSLAKMVFLLGGAYAVRKAGTMITSLISAGAGSSEQETGSMVTNAGSAFGGYIAGKLGNAALSGISNAYSNLRGGGSKGGQGGEGGGKYDGAGGGSVADTSMGGKAAFEATKFKGDSMSDGFGEGGGFGGSGGSEFGADSSAAGEDAGSSRFDGGDGDAASSMDAGDAAGGAADAGAAPSAGDAGAAPSAGDMGAAPSAGDMGAAPAAKGMRPSNNMNAMMQKTTQMMQRNTQMMQKTSQMMKRNLDMMKSMYGGKPAPAAGGGAFAGKQKEENGYFKSTKPAAGEKLLRKGFFGFKKYRHADGSTSWAFKPGKGSLFSIGRDNKGTNLKILGFGVRWGKDGKINKVSLPTTKLKLGNDGKLHVSKFNAGVVGFKASSKDGKLNFSSCNLIGLKREEDSRGEFHVTRVGALGMKREMNINGEYQTTHLGFGSFSMNKERQEDGKYHTTSALGGLYQRSFYKNEDGELKTAGVRALGINFYLNDDVMEKRGGTGGKY